MSTTQTTTEVAASDRKGARRKTPPGAPDAPKETSWIRSIVVLTLTALAALPLYYIVVSSFKTKIEMAKSPMALPKSLNFSNYTDAAAQTDLGGALLNSLIITVGAVALQVLVGSLAAYAMVIGSGKLVAFFGGVLAVAFAIPLQAVLVPQYRMMAGAGLTDSLLGLILLYSGGAIFCYFLMVGYMRKLPLDLISAARLDGASPLRIYWSIIMPLSRPILITVVVFQTMSTWNDFLTPNVYLSTPEKRTIVLQVYNAVGLFATNWPLFMAITVVALLPVFIFFIFAQKWIVSGLMAGSVKG